MSSLGSPSPFFLAGKKAYAVDRSLRFNDDDSPNLNRQYAQEPTSQYKMTFSCWVKRCSSDSGIQTVIGVQDNWETPISFSNDSLRVVGPNQSATYITTAKYRDFSAWMHVMTVYDTQNSTGADRMICYINGERLTDFSTSGTVTLNQTVVRALRSGYNTYIGRDGVGNYADMYIAEVNVIDGQAYDPSYFTETDSTTGQLIPKKYTESYGTNGFYLNFSDNSGTTATTLGKDSSGNSNNFTPNNFSVAAGAGNDSLEDSPTNNFCTLNPLSNGTGAAPSNGNLDFATTSSATGTMVTTIPVSSGKWYCEATITFGSNNGAVGIRSVDQSSVTTNTLGNQTLDYAYRGNGQKFNSNSKTSYGSSYTTNDVIGIALDLDGGTIKFFKNNSDQGTAFSSITGTYVFAIGDDNTSSAFNGSFNFGQRAFTYTPPTGFKAVNSANLPDPTILLPNKHFDTVIYTGNGNATRTFSDVLNFQPDWLWLKSRSLNYSHILYDAVRGAGTLKALNSNETRIESGGFDNSTYGFLSSFESKGFSVTNGSNSVTYTNSSGTTYVAWNWNAGDTDGKTYTVTVVSDSGNKYRFDGFGTSAVTLELAEGGTYIFDQSDSSNAGHPLRFYTAADKTGGEYTTGVTTAGTPGSSGAYTQIVVAASAPTLYYQCSVHAGMGGQANTNSTLGSSNFDGTIQSTVKANQTAGFSIITHSGNDVDGATIGHGLGVPPVFRISKSRNLGTLGFGEAHWTVNHQSLTGGMNGGNSAKELFLNLNNAESPNYHGTVSAVSSTTMTLKNGTNNDVNAHINHSGGTYVTYCFSEVAGYSKFGLYTGNGSSDGVFVFLGFRPSVVIQKRTDTTGHWYIFDNKRNGFNVDNDSLSPNLLDTEYDVTIIDLLSNGFKLRTNAVAHNGSGGTYIYLAFAESPFKNARAR